MATSDAGEPVALTCTVTHDDGSVTLALAGEVDLGTAPALAEAVDAVHADGRPLVLDVSKLTFFDSSGVSVLIEALKHGPISIACADGMVRRVLEVCGFGDLIIDTPAPAESG